MIYSFIIIFILILSVISQIQQEQILINLEINQQNSSLINYFKKYIDAELELKRVESEDQSNVQGRHEENKRILEQLNHEITLELAPFAHYTFQLEIGSQMFTVQFDIQQSQLWVASTACSNCKFANKKYDISSQNSNNDSKQQENQERVQNQYKLLKGMISHDIVKLPDGLNTYFPFLAVTLAPKIQIRYETDGKLEFGRVQSSDPPNTNCFNNNNLVNQLFNEGKIKRNMFALSINVDNPRRLTHQFDYSVNSYLFIGGYNESLVVQGQKDINFYRPISDKRWAIEIKGVKFGNKVIQYNPSKAYLASAIKYLQLPKKTFDEFEKQIKSLFDPECYDIMGLLGCVPCTQDMLDKMPTLKIVLGDTVDGKKDLTIALKPEDYLLRDANRNVSCIFTIAESFQSRDNYFDADNEITVDDWILGDNFLKKVHAIFDYENNQIGFVKLEDNPDETIEQQSYFVEIFIASLFIAVCIFFVYRYYQRKKEKTYDVNDGQITVVLNELK